MRKLSVLLLGLALSPESGYAATIHVPGDQPTIQAAVDAASSGDTILLASGTHTGVGNRDIYLPNYTTLTVRSESGDASTCIIDCQGQGRAFSFSPYVLVDPVLEDVTILNGAAASGGGALIQGEPTLNRCVFISCQATGSGPTGHGGALAIGGNPAINDCTFIANSASETGGAIMVWANTVFTSCRFLGNSAGSGGGVAVAEYSGSRFSDCVFAENVASVTGGGLAAFSTCLEVYGCTFTGNVAESSIDAAGGIYAEYNDFVCIENSILAFNEGVSVVAMLVYSPIRFICTDIYGNAGGDWVGGIANSADVLGNFSSNPLFCNPDNGDFTIQSDSPCAPPGVTGCGLVGALGVGCGPVSVVEESWAGIKARYR